MNPTESVVDLPARTESGWYQEVVEWDVMPVWESTELSDSQNRTVEENVKALNIQSRAPAPEVPEHLLELGHNTTKSDQFEEQRQKLTSPLQQYSHDIGRTHLVDHHISLVPKAQPIRQPAQRLKHEKELQAEKQIKDPKKQGVINPGNEPWSSPVFLVKKKDNSWRFLHRLSRTQ